MRVVRWTALFLRSEKGVPFDSPLRGGGEGSACWRCIDSAALCAAARQRGYSLSEENTPFGTPRERRGASPSTPDIAGLQLEGLHALRSAGAVYVASPRVSAFRYRQQPRPTPWGACDGRLAADCLRSGGIASLAARWGDGADSRKHLRGDCGIALLAAAFRILLTYRFLRPFVGR